MVVKTFRGLLADGGQDRLSLHTNDGKTGYKIVKFEAFPNLPGTTDWESTLQIWRIQQTSISTSTAAVDFANSDLLAALYYAESSNVSYSGLPTVVFDNEIFNQDIYITHTETDQSTFMNYYIELEVIPLATDEATVATLKDIRASA